MHPLSDVRYALRQLAKAPGHTAVVATTTALAIGACTVVFSIVNTILLHPLEGVDTDRVVLIRPTGYAGVGRAHAEGHHFDEWLAHARSFEAIYGFTAAFTTSTTKTGEPFRMGTRWVRGDYLGVIGVQPVLGRGFLPEELQAASKVVLIKHRLWKRAFPGVQDPIGQTLSINDEPHTIIGVLPQSKDADTFSASQIDAWVPFAPTGSGGPVGMTTEARLKRGVQLVPAQDEVNRLAAAAPRVPGGDAEFRYVVLDKATFITSKSGPVLWSLLGAVGCVLLVACANIANLMLARTAARHREVAVRGALGATRGHIARLLITECLLLALLGGGLGVLVSVGALQVVRRSAMATAGTVGENGTGLYRLPYAQLDWHVLGFALAATLVAGLLFGLAPTLLGSRTDLNEALKERGRGSIDGPGRGRLRSALVVAENALAMVLLVGTGLFLRSFLTVTAIDPGFVAREAVTLNYALPRKQYSSPESRTAFHRRVEARLHDLPRVEAVAFGNLPIVHDPPWLRYEVDGQSLPEDARPTATTFIATTEYFQAVGVPLLRGRTFHQAENTERVELAKIVVVNAALARRRFPNEDAVGKRLALAGPRGPNVVEIVGVVGDVRQNGPERAVSDQIYFPFVPAGRRHVLIVRGQADAAALLGIVRAEMLALEPGLVIADDAPLQTVLDNQVVQRRFIVELLAVLSALALAIAAVGVYAVIAYNVAQRTGEIGIRVALGARAADVVGMVLRQGARLVGLGLVIGLGASLIAGRLVEAMLFETSARDPLALVAVSLLLAFVAALACWVPARRAARVDPMVALRAE